MSPSVQLKWANFWTVVGITPFTVLVCWSIAALSTVVPNQPPMIRILDPFAMIALGFMSYLFMLAVAGPQVWRAWALTSYHVELRSKAALGLRIAIAVLVSCPFIFSLYPQI